MLTPEQKTRLSKLSPEQQAIAEKWEKEREIRDEIFNQLIQATNDSDLVLFQEAMDKLSKNTPSMCEHERSIWSNCAGCDEIEQALHPELFCAECGVPFEMISSEEAEKEHKEGDICPDCLYEEEMN